MLDPLTLPPEAEALVLDSEAPLAMRVGLHLAAFYSGGDCCAVFGHAHSRHAELAGAHIMRYRSGPYRARYAAVKALTFGLGVLSETERAALASGDGEPFHALPYRDLWGATTLLEGLQLWYCWRAPHRLTLASRINEPLPS